MNFKGLHEKILLKDTFIYSVFKDFIDAYTIDSNYDLMRMYLFRTDSLLRSIKDHSCYFYNENDDYLINGKINYKNEQVKKYVNNYKSLHIGNVYLKSRGFRPIFIYFTNNHEKNAIDAINISGYSINAGDEFNSYFYDKSTTKALRKITHKDMNKNIIFSSYDLKENIFKLCENTRKALEP